MLEVLLHYETYFSCDPSPKRGCICKWDFHSKGIHSSGLAFVFAFLCAAGLKQRVGLNHFLARISFDPFLFALKQVI